jgi:hypothetical protein
VTTIHHQWESKELQSESVSTQRLRASDAGRGDGRCGDSLQVRLSANALREQLATVLHCVLCNHPYLSYFQGMHDIASALLLVFRSERITYFALERLCMFHIRDACARSLDEIQSVLWLLFPLLRLFDRRCRCVRASGAFDGLAHDADLCTALGA